MSKIQVSQVAEILKKHHIEPSVLREIVEEMNEVTAPAEGEDIAPPASKKQFVIVISDPERKLPKLDLVGWVLQLPECESPYLVQEHIRNAAYDFNASKKGRLLPVNSVGEALESVSAKFFRERGVSVKTKTVVAVAVTDNVLPKDEFHHIDKRKRAE